MYTNNKSKRNSKNTLLNYIKPKTEQVNTLQNYNFKISKPRSSQHSKLLKGKDYEDFDRVLYEMRREQSKALLLGQPCNERPFKDDLKSAEKDKN